MEATTMEATVEAVAAVRGEAKRADGERVEALERVAALASDSTVAAELADSKLLGFLLTRWDASQVASEDGERVKKSAWKSVKWRAVARIVRANRLSAEDRELLLEAMAGDRFSSPDVLLAVVDAAVATVQAVNSPSSLLSAPAGDGESFPTLLKQLYVTLNDSCIRQDISNVIVSMVQSKDHAKLLLRSQILRSVLRVALDGSSLHNDTEDLPLVYNCVQLLRCVVVRICDCTDDLKEESDLRAMCEMIVRLMLSRSTLAFEEAVRMLQTIVEIPACRSHVVECVHLRGALEKAHRFAELKPGGLASDPYLVMLCKEHYAHLRPEIDELERKRGSLVQLPNHLENGNELMDTDTALHEASRYKERGNWFFRRGNFPTSRAFYRHAVLVLRMTQQREEQKLEQLSRTQKLERCNVGASVQVLVFSRDGRNTRWCNAMVADVEDDRHIEVVFDEQPNEEDDSDAQEEEEVVTLNRIRLQLNTKTLNAFSKLQVDCFMNMGKAASGMYDNECAVEGFTSALELDPTNTAALYHRGVSYMALHDLKPAQQDLWNANQHCRAALKSNSSLATTTAEEDEYQKQLKATKALQRQVTTAYKRLQQLHASKKKMDKKVIKEMMRYLSSIPGLQGDQ